MGSLCHISNIIVDYELQQEDIERYMKEAITLDEECMQKIFDVQMSLWGISSK